MKRDNHNRHIRRRATPGFKVSKRRTVSGKVLIERVELNENLTKTPREWVPKGVGGVGVAYYGPSVEGGDKEYVKVLTGDVDRRKPSFV